LSLAIDVLAIDVLAIYVLAIDVLAIGVLAIDVLYQGKNFMYFSHFSNEQIGTMCLSCTIYSLYYHISLNKT
jgi:hypothetical protein